MDISLINNGIKFKVRVAGIFIFDNKILVDKYDGKSYLLPGGCVEITENTEKALLRELKEETELEFKINKFGGIIENFYINLKGVKTHSIEFYYFVELEDNKSINRLNMNYIENDKNGIVRHQYNWIPLDDITKYNIIPNIVKENLKIDNSGFHYIVDEVN